MEYPECEKMKAASEDSQVIGEFLEWLGQQGIQLCKYQKEDVYHFESEEAESQYNELSRIEQSAWRYNNPSKFGTTYQGYNLVNINTEKLLAQYFKIDLNKVEQEKRQIINSLRNPTLQGESK